MAKQGDIQARLRTADALLEQDKYQEAYFVFDEVTTGLMKALDDSSSARKISKGAGWVAALLTGGFGAEDFIVVPMVNKLLMKFLGIDLDDTLRMLFTASSRKLFICGLDRSIAASVSQQRVLLDFLIAYRLIGDQSDKGFLDNLMTLINPFAEDSGISGRETQLAVNDLLAQLFPEVQRRHEQVYYLNGLLFLYLTDRNLTSNRLYQALLMAQQGRQSSYRGSGGRIYNSPADEEAEKARYYGEIFNLQGKVTKDDIRKRYRELMKAYHPDKMTHATEAEKKAAEEKVKKINEAYEYFKKKYGI